jgi:hypothetical protein
MELLINVVFALIFGIGLGGLLSAMMGLLWMFWDMFLGKKGKKD